MKHMQKYVMTVFALAIVLSVLFMHPRSENRYYHDDGYASEDAKVLSEKMQQYVIRNMGQPIDGGFTAGLYRTAFSGLIPQDFDGVRTAEGRYVFTGHELSFEHDESSVFSTYAEAIESAGSETLYRALRKRFAPETSADELFEAIKQKGIGNVRVTFALRNACTVASETSDCVRNLRDVELIVSDTADGKEYIRFEPEIQGAVPFFLPAGTYVIRVASPTGADTQSTQFTVFDDRQADVNMSLNAELIRRFVP